MLKNIVINCKSNFTGDCYYNIRIYLKGHAIYSKWINSPLTIRLQCNRNYTFVVAPNMPLVPQYLYFTTCIRPCSKRLITFCFKQNTIIRNIRVTDRNYEGLPIEKGEIILWQPNTQ